MEPIEADNIPIKCKDCYFIQRYLKIKWDKKTVDGLETSIEGWIFGNLQARLTPTIPQLCYALGITPEEMGSFIAENGEIGNILKLAKLQLTGILMTQGKTKLAETYMAMTENWESKNNTVETKHVELSIKGLSKYITDETPMEIRVAYAKLKDYVEDKLND